MPIREREVEAHLVRAVAAAGGWAVKLIGVMGLPDRLVLMPGGRFWFVEVKTVGGRLSKMQEVCHRKLRRLGFSVLVVWNRAEVDEFIQTTGSATDDH